jgi:hypothetical protein
MKLSLLMASALALVVMASACFAADPPLSAADKAALMAPVTKFTAALNASQPDLPAGLFTPDAIVVDAFGPYRWAGAGSGIAQWYADLMGATPEDHAKIVAQKLHLVIKAPQYARITGDDAYLIVPGTFTFNDETGAHKQVARWVITEKKVNGAWLISAHVWGLTEDK